MKSYQHWEQKTSGTEYLMKSLQKIVTSIDPGAEVILFGSRARGGGEAASDWDFLILTEKKLSRKSILETRDRVYDLELETDTVLSIVVRTKEEWNSPKYSALPFKHAVETEGILL